MEGLLALVVVEQVLEVLRLAQPVQQTQVAVAVAADLLVLEATVGMAAPAS